MADGSRSLNLLSSHGLKPDVPYGRQSWSISNVGIALLPFVLRNNELRVVIWRKANKSPELICKLDALCREHRDVASVGRDRGYSAVVNHRYDLRRLAIGERLELFQQLLAGRIDSAAVSDEGGQIISKTIWECVNSPLRLLRAGQQGSTTLKKRLLDVIHEDLSRPLPSRTENQSAAPNVNCVEPLWQVANFVQEKPTDDSGVCSPQVHGLFVLLLCDLGCLIRNMRCALRRSVRQQSNPNSCCGSPCSNDRRRRGAHRSNCNSSPVRPTSPIGRQRTYLDRHRFSPFATDSAMTSIHVQPTFDLATQAEKDRQRAEIADDVAQFLRSGGKVKILGNSPIDRSTISRRQVVEGGHDSRTKKGASA